MDIKGKVAVITGASGGIGGAIAIKLASLKLNLALLGRNEGKLLEIKNEVEKYGVKAEIFIGDLLEDEFSFKVLDDVVNVFGGFDILINNAGLTLNSTLENTSIEDYDKIMRLNARVPYILCKQSLKYLRKSQIPSIINITSIVGHNGYVNQSAYSASKHALVGFTQSLAKEVYKEGIRVHLIAPGGVYTDMVKISRPDLTPEGMIMPQDIADIVEFYLTHRTNAVVDEILVHRIGKEPFN